MSLLMKRIEKKGEVAEWFKAHAWKACKGAILSWVQIPFSPPTQSIFKTKNFLIIFLFKKSNRTSRSIKVFFEPKWHVSFG